MTGENERKPSLRELAQKWADASGVTLYPWQLELLRELERNGSRGAFPIIQRRPPKPISLDEFRRLHFNDPNANDGAPDAD